MDKTLVRAQELTELTDWEDTLTPQQTDFVRRLIRNQYIPEDELAMAHALAERDPQFKKAIEEAMRVRANVAITLATSKMPQAIQAIADLLEEGLPSERIRAVHELFDAYERLLMVTKRMSERPDEPKSLQEFIQRKLQEMKEQEDDVQMAHPSTDSAEAV